MWWSIRLPLQLLGVVAPVLCCGCETAVKMRLHGQLTRADRAFNEGNYPLAATRYESLSDRYPPGRTRQRLTMRRGIAYYTIASYQAARGAFLEYLREYPAGHYAQDAHDYVHKIDVLKSPGSPATQEALTGATRDLDALRQLHVEHPNDSRVVTAIANLYYELGDYEEAVRYYHKALELDAPIEERRLANERMMLDEEGRPIPVTPDEVARIHREKRPLVIFNLHDYKARDLDNDVLQAERFFTVSGMVRNQNSRILHDVEIEVRFFNVNHRILDVRVVHVGILGPGEVRAFRADADSYDSLYNIAQYECIPRGWE